MFIKKLETTQFKNLESLRLDLDPKPGITILLGQNGQGKTNILESIWLLSLPRPLRSRSLKGCIKFEGNNFRIEGEFEDNQIEELSLSYQANPQKVKMTLNYGELQLKEWIGKFQVTLFTPDDTNLISGEPGQRRRYLDQLLSRVDPEYFINLRRYKQCLQQRNTLLKNLLKNPKLTSDSNSQIEAWDGQMLAAMEVVVKKRWDYLQFLKDNLAATYEQIASTDEQIAIEPEGSLEYGALEKVSDLKAKFNSYGQRDRRTGTTNFGPHRDEINFMINQMPCRIVSSRGEIRSLTLAIKLCEIKFIKESTGKSPVLLLDDVFSELDRPRREQLLALTENHQTIITTVEPSYFKEYEGNTKIISINAGKAT